MAEVLETLVVEVPPELFSPAECAMFEGVYDLGAFECGPDEYTPQAPLAWNAQITNVGGALLVSGSVNGVLNGTCSRCLEDMQVQVEGELEGYFIIEGEGEAPADMDEDEFDVLPEDKKIDLAPIIQAAVIMELPLQPLCDEECKGMCVQCGANLNEGPCSCAETSDEEDEFAAANNPFAALKGLKFD